MGSLVGGSGQAGFGQKSAEVVFRSGMRGRQLPQFKQVTCGGVAGVDFFRLHAGELAAKCGDGQIHTTSARAA